MELTYYLFANTKKIVLKHENRYYEFFYDPQTQSIWNHRELLPQKESTPTHTSFSNQQDQQPLLRAALSGRIARICCSPGTYVHRGDPLLFIEAMKMENIITAHRDGIIKTIFIHPGNVVKQNEPLLMFEKEGETHV